VLLAYVLTLQDLVNLLQGVVHGDFVGEGWHEPFMFASSLMLTSVRALRPRRAKPMSVSACLALSFLLCPLFLLGLDRREFVVCFGLTQRPRFDHLRELHLV